MVLLYHLQIYNGVKEGKKVYANTEDVLTREEGFVLLDRLGDFRGNNPHSRFVFEDAWEISEFAYDSVNDLVDLWLICGYSDHTIKPKEPMKREDFLNLLNKVVKCPSRPDDQEREGEYFLSTIQDKDFSKQVEVVLKNNMAASLEDSIFFRFANYANTEWGYSEENFVVEIEKEGKWYVVPMK